MDAYLDIETSGLSPFFHKITVIGLVLGNRQRVVQLVGNNITAERLLKALEQVTTIYTYNGGRFDLPFLSVHLGIDLLDGFDHHDLMLDCWERDLYGGLKAVEKRLGISRMLKGIHGLDAILLWRRYERFQDHDALRILLDYNREDVLNLRALRKALANQDLL